MFRFLLTPRWLAIHTFFVLAVAFCVFAGWWQLGAFQDSQTRHDDRDRPPVAVEELVRAGEAIDDAAADRAAVATGTYLSEQRRFVPGRIHNGALGWFVLMPLETSDGTILPVVQGWVAERADAGPPPDPPVTVTGHLLPAEIPEHATMRHDQILDDDELAYISPESLAETIGVPAAASVHGYLLLTSEEPAAAGIARLDINEVAPIRHVNPWQNLSYWAQWWVFGLAALVFWGSAIRSGIRARRNGDGQDTEPDPDQPGPDRAPDSAMTSPSPHERVSAPEPPRVLS
ncbi:SURF1 family protein [Phytoactinopolyspora limicola]|uniref:SURF1 family protein n=1 Tax=Phytoactinopolyspora limicola TaxID=2715536 RepID=UPI00140C3894|nr:SURF1 family protein [Phytoactinopolyspora limicola]